MPVTRRLRGPLTTRRAAAVDPPRPELRQRPLSINQKECGMSGWTRQQCSVPERSNELVIAMGYKPYMQTVEITRRGKRPASTKEVRKQHVDVFFAFHPSGL